MTGIWNIGNFELLLLYLRQMLGLNSALVIDTMRLPASFSTRPASN